MLLLVIHISFRKYLNPKRLIKPLSQDLFSVLSHIGFITNLLFSIVLSSQISTAQNLSLNYQINRNGNTIGWVRIEKITAGNKSNLHLVSEVKTNIVFPISVFSNESSVFENGILTYSCFNRKVNGRAPSEVKVKWEADFYELSNNNKKTNLSLGKIESNLLSLYFQEPTISQQIFSERHQHIIQYIKTNDGGYLLLFPDGNSNCYYYKDGVCSKIIIKHKFYTLDIILISSNTLTLKN